MKPIRSGNKLIAGTSIRTRNIDELDPAQAKIPGLWSDFYGRVLNQMVSGYAVHGVYTEYDPDGHGYYRLMAGVEVDKGFEAPEGIELIEIGEDSYLLFEKQGIMPEMVYQLWQQIWDYFDDPECPYTRAFTTDYECYKSDKEMQIYISIETDQESA